MAKQNDLGCRDGIGTNHWGLGYGNYNLRDSRSSEPDQKKYREDGE